jgi:exopolysaccharide/PEP-CTERM locus tyrosine autokinase
VHPGDPDKSAPVFEVGEPIVDPAAVDEHLVCIKEPDSLAAEQYKILRARAIRSMGKDKMNSLLVTSAHAGEGKTTTAINLAVTMAKSIDHTFLLIDADLRKPSVHTYLGLKPKYGLSDCLQSNVQLSKALIKTGIGKLVILPAGAPVKNSAELLASGKMKDLIKEMKYRYNDRYIIFDSSPLLTTSDVINFGTEVDGIIFVAQALRTSQKSAAQALSLIQGCRILGTVFNNVPSFLSAKPSPYKYGYFKPLMKEKKADAPVNKISAWIGKIFHHQS